MHSALLNHACLDDLHFKATRTIFALNKRYKFHKLLVNMVLKCFDSLNLSNTSVTVKSGIHIRGITFSLGIKLKFNKFIYSFFKRLVRVLNISTRNITVRAELGTLERRSEKIIICFGQIR